MICLDLDENWNQRKRGEDFGAICSRLLIGCWETPLNVSKHLQETESKNSKAAELKLDFPEFNSLCSNFILDFSCCKVAVGGDHVVRPPLWGPTLWGPTLWTKTTLIIIRTVVNSNREVEKSHRGCTGSAASPSDLRADSEPEGGASAGTRPRSGTAPPRWSRNSAGLSQTGRRSGPSEASHRKLRGGTRFSGNVPTSV